MPRPGSRKILMVSLFLFLAVALSAAQTQVASLHSNNGLVWRRTSPTAQKPDGPVLYQLLFSTAGIPNQVAKFDTNPRHLTNSLLSDDGSNVRVGTGNIFAIASNGIITFASGQTFPGGGAGTVTSVGLAAPVSDFNVTGSPVTGNGTLTLNWVVAPATLNTASAIVRRDAGGNFGATTVTLDGNLGLPSTTSSSVGVLTVGGSRFLHAFGPANTFVGIIAGNFSLTGGLNTAVGAQALQSDTSGDSNSALGDAALNFNTTGAGNTASGVNALFLNTGGGFNTAIGQSALYSNTTGNYNVAIGREAGYTGTSANANTTGSQNTFIGVDAGPGTSTQLTNATAIGSNAKVSSSNSLVLGDNTVNVGIGTPTPGAKLDVVGTVRVGNATTTGTTIGAIQAGTATLGTSGTQEAQFTITFPSTFASTPHVVVTARAADSNAADVFAVSTRSISTTQFVINIIRLDTLLSGPPGWGQNLQLDWFAWQ